MLGECVRVMKPNGKILIIEFNVENFAGFLGWFRKLGVSVVEFSAGKEHFSGFQDFATNQGLAKVIGDLHLEIEKRVSSRSGIFAILLLRR